MAGWLHFGCHTQAGELSTASKQWIRTMIKVWNVCCAQKTMLSMYVYIYCTYTDISYSYSCFWTWFQSVRTRINSNCPHYCRICIGFVLDDVLKWILNALNQHFLRWRGDQWEAQFDQHKCAEFEGHVRPKTFLTWPEIASFSPRFLGANDSGLLNDRPLAEG